MNSIGELPRVWNTKKSGVIEFLIYKEKDAYVGVCLSFNIIEEGDDIQKVSEQLEEAARLHLRVVRDENLPDALLNRHAPKEYWDKYFSFLEATKKQELGVKDRVSEASIKSYPDSFVLV